MNKFALFNSESKLSNDKVHRLFDYILDSSNFLLLMACYTEQIDGVCMGRAIGPLLANVFLDNLESSWLYNGPVKPLFWRRYVDDVLAIFDDEATADLLDVLIRGTLISSLPLIDGLMTALIF